MIHLYVLGVELLDVVLEEPHFGPVAFEKCILALLNNSFIVVLDLNSIDSRQLSLHFGPEIFHVVRIYHIFIALSGIPSSKCRLRIPINLS
jgi:hypothetical protein